MACICVPGTHHDGWLLLLACTRCLSLLHAAGTQRGTETVNGPILLLLPELHAGEGWSTTGYYHAAPSYLLAAPHPLQEGLDAGLVALPVLQQPAPPGPRGEPLGLRVTSKQRGRGGQGSTTPEAA